MIITNWSAGSGFDEIHTLTAVCVCVCVCVRACVYELICPLLFDRWVALSRVSLSTTQTCNKHESDNRGAR